VKNKNNKSGYIWTLLHLLLVSVAVYFALKAIAFDYNHPMASEENSFLLGISGVVWVLGMICLVIALFSFSKNRKQSTS
jgi:ABC-type polysaccharide/polyol phosphate export permease